jgi:DNA polymerase III delta subunit
MTYLFIGPDLPKKDAKIAELKDKLFGDPSALAFDYETLYAHKLDPDTLKKSLLALPHIAPKRLVVLRQCERLRARSLESDENQPAPKNRNLDILLEFLNDQPKTTVLVLDFEELDLKGALFGKLKPLTEVSFFGNGRSLNVFDMTRAISGRNAAEALKILYQLLDDNIHPLQIMGGLVWYWGKERDHLNPKRFQQGLMVLEEADLNIKRSRLKPEYAIEKVVVELAGLQ